MKNSIGIPLLLVAIMATACKPVTCVQVQPESLRDVWKKRDQNELQGFRSFKYSLLPNPDRSGHINVSVIRKKECPISPFSDDVLNRLLSRAQAATLDRPNYGPTCQMRYELKQGQWDQAMDTVELVHRTGAKVLLVTPTRYGSNDESMYLDVEAYETCADLKLAMKFAFEGQTKIQRNNVNFESIKNAFEAP
jgi:hypothetical protein